MLVLSPRQLSSPPQVWLRPTPNIIKINFDAAWAKSGAASYGCVARNDAGEVLAAATMPALHGLSSLLAEAAAFRWCLGLALELGFRVVTIETDCKALFDAWSKQGNGCSYLFSVISDCRDLSCCFALFSFSCIRRTGNKVANHLAKHAGDFGDSVWIDEVPIFFMPLVLDDVRASVPT